jgi:hypothetical protein
MSVTLPGTGSVVKTEAISSEEYQYVKLALGAAGAATLLSGGSGAIDAGTQRVALATDSPGVNPIVVISTDITRPADTTAYAAGDALANSTSSPTTGGFTLTGAAKASGKGGIVTGATVISSNAAATGLQCEIWLFDQAVTAINDNAAFALSDADAKLCLGKIPATLVKEATNNSQAAIPNVGLPFQCVGSANLRFLVKVLNAYTPISAEVLTVRLGILQGD